MTGKKLLIVDDEKEYLQVLTNYFEKKGVATVAADRCSKALEIIIETPVDVVILDMMMPGLSGMECMAMMKSIQPSIQVIMLSGCCDLHTGITGMRNGAFDYLLKPAIPSELYEKVLLARNLTPAAHAV